MKTLTVSDIVKATGGTLLSGSIDTPITSISTDTRKIEQNSLFVPLKGENFDGHNFIQDAFSKGSVATVSQQAIQSTQAVILVEDTQLALQAIAKYYRMLFDIPFVAITGSVGKTTTKEMVSAVLESTYNTLKTQGNFNNEIGVPLTVFGLSEDNEVAVIEMGMSGFGEIDRISNIIQPDIAILTNIGMSHIELLGSQENIYKAKSELLGHTKSDGTVIINGDDAILRSHKNEIMQKVITVGINHTDCDSIAKDIVATQDDVIFTFIGLGKEFRVHLGVPGEHNIYNALIACSVGILQNVPIENIQAALENYVHTNMRMNIIKTEQYTVIDDCYNAAPASMEAAIKVLCAYQNVRTVAVLGDILCLGDFAQSAHFSVGKTVQEYGVDLLFTIGENAKYIAQGAVQNGMEQNRISSFNDMADLLTALDNQLNEGDIILVKASRGMKLEQVTKHLVKD